jgi:hypothetical protein
LASLDRSSVTPWLKIKKAVHGLPSEKNQAGDYREISQQGKLNFRFPGAFQSTGHEAPLGGGADPADYGYPVG